MRNDRAVDFLFGLFVGGILSYFLVFLFFRQGISEAKSEAIQKGYAKYIVVDSKGNTEFKWICDIIENNP